jgi:iron complex transport system substrate-binding protein
MSLRVASLIPSGTEIVSALGMAHTLVGRSHACDYPPEVGSLPVLSRPRVDPTRPGAEIDEAVRRLLRSGDSIYEIDLDAIRACAPDVVITQDHCDVCAVSLGDVEAAAACAQLTGALLCSLHPHDLPGVQEDFMRVASALGVEGRGSRLVGAFRARLDALEDGVVRGAVRPRVAFVEWLEPPMVAGGWIPELARIAGLDPVIVEDSRSFAEVSWADVAHAAPDGLLLLPCGFSVARTMAELERPLVQAGVDLVSAGTRLGCYVVDGDALFNRPGPRLADSAELLAALFRPGALERGPSRFAGQFRRYA